MDAKICLKKLREAGVLSFATVGANGDPQVRCISAIHYAPDALYFFTARGKAFCGELLRDGRVQVLGYTRQKEMLRLSAKAVPVPEDEQRRWIDVIFSEQPYLKNVYPGETRAIGIVFEIRDAEIEYFNLGVHPIFRETCALGAARATPHGFVITAACTGCGLCAAHCPQHCITTGTPFEIQQAHCLHCGSCRAVCPAHAVAARSAV